MTPDTEDVTPTPDSTEMDPELAGELARELADIRARYGVEVKLEKKDVTTVAQLVEDCRRSYPSRDTGRTYMTAFKILRDGFGAICDQTCEPCLVETTKFKCGCGCRSCRDSAIELKPQGDLLVGPDTLSARNFELVIRATRRLAIKRGIVENRARAKKGKPAKTAPGIGAEETAVAALRSLFDYAARHGFVDGDNPGRAIDKPRRPGSTRRALADFELVELYDLTATGGDDPALDLLLVDFGIESGSRREGAYEFTMGQIKPLEQLLDDEGQVRHAR